MAEILSGAGRAPRRGRPALGLAAVLGAGLALRMAVSVMAFASTFDTATPGLMALHILKGERPLFYYGQSYMGALEAYLAAVLFKLFGVSELSLSLSPILFSLAWIAATYLLFRDLLDERGGMAGALVVSFPGWHALWYNIGSYGGYPATFFFGTAALWLCVRLATRELSPRAEWAHMLGLGLASGLGLWTNYQAASYILTGGLLVLVYLWRVRLAPRVVGPLAAGGLCFLLGFWPVLLADTGGDAGGRLTQWNFSPHYLLHTLRLMVHGELRYLMFPDVRMALPIKAFVLVLIGLGLCLYLARVASAAGVRERGRTLVPLLYVVVFLAMFLPHALASVRAPRYAIPLWTMITCALFAMPVTLRHSALRRAAWALLAMWTAYNAVGDFVMARLERPKKREAVAERRRAVATAERIGARHVVLVGGHIFGHMGQVLTLYAQDRVRFVAVHGERYHPAAQAAEMDPAVVLACEGSKLGKVKRALTDLGVSFQSEKSWLGFFYDLRVPPTARRSIPPSEMTVNVAGSFTGAPAALLDRVAETAVEGEAGEGGGFTLDLGRERDLDGLWLWTDSPYGSGLPEKLDVSVSSDGARFQTVPREHDSRTAVAYLCGNQAYVKGYHGWFEVRFPPGTVGRYVRVAIASAVDLEERWRAAEVFAFERAGEGTPVSEEEVEALAAALVERGVSFTVCDRWLSAQLLQRLPREEGAYPVYPRFNPKAPATRLSRRVVPRAGLALAVERGLAEECTTLLEAFCGGQPWQTVDFPHYLLLVFGPAARPAPGAEAALQWTGATLLKTASAEKAGPG